MKDISFWAASEVSTRSFCALLASLTSVVFPSLISDPRRGCFMGLSMFIFFFFFPATFVRPISLEPLLAETPNSVCCLVLRSSFALCLPSNSLCYFFFLYFFPPRFCPGHISGTITRRDSKLSVLLGPAV